MSVNFKNKNQVFCLLVINFGWWEANKIVLSQQQIALAHSQHQQGHLGIIIIIEIS